MMTPLTRVEIWTCALLTWIKILNASLLPIPFSKKKIEPFINSISSIYVGYYGLRDFSQGPSVSKILNAKVNVKTKKGCKDATQIHQHQIQIFFLVLVGVFVWDVSCILNEFFKRLA